MGAYLQIYPTHANRTDLLLLIGAIYYQLGNYEQCIAFNDRCILLDAQMAEAHANLANALQQLGNFDMAIIYYQAHTPNDTGSVDPERQHPTDMYQHHFRLDWMLFYLFMPMDVCKCLASGRRGTSCLPSPLKR